MLALLDRRGSSSVGDPGWLAEFSPLLWGPPAVSHYSAKKESRATSLWRVPKASEVLSLIEPEKMSRTAADFPLDLPLDASTDAEADDKADGDKEEEDGVLASPDDKGRYDPRFFLPVLSQLCSPGSYVDRHLHLVERGGLALALAALSSHHQDVRKAGYLVLARIHQVLARSICSFRFVCT